MTRALNAERAKHAEKNRTRRSRRPQRSNVSWFCGFVVSCLLLSASSALAQQSHVLVVTGVAGDDEHAKKFQEWATTFIDTAKKKEAIPEANITLLADKNATKANVEKAFADIAAKAKPTDNVVILLIGHGSFDGRQAAFNLPGPDLTAADYAKLLAEVHARVVFVNTASASGPFVQALAAPDRTVITATRTGGERNETRFGGYFVAALSDAAADRDHDGNVSMLEAFDYAKAQVEDAYRKEGLILTEHAGMDDGHEGRQAAAMIMRGTPAATADRAASASDDPALRALVAEKQALEERIAQLRVHKGEMPADVYAQELEKLVTELAVKTKMIREREAKK